jgi:hypothetical protein
MMVERVLDRREVDLIFVAGGRCLGIGVDADMHILGGGGDAQQQ